MKKQSNNPKRRRLRLQGYDYGQNGIYFITICTLGRYPYFGKEEKSIAERIWHLIPEQFPFVKINNFIVMPDHVHGIIIINRNNGNELIHGINPMATEAEPKIGGFAGLHNPILHQNLFTIIRWFKGRCTFEIRKINAEFSWQSLFYDMIIKDLEGMKRIQKYIDENPENLNKSKD